MALARYQLVDENPVKRLEHLVSSENSDVLSQNLWIGARKFPNF